MPVSIATTKDPFRGQEVSPTRRSENRLRTPQAHLLRAMIPIYPDDPVSEWPLFTRAGLQRIGGYSPTNSLNRLLNGVAGKSLGLLGLGLIEVVPVNIDGVTETNYRITPKGLECLSHHDANGDRK